MKLLALLEKWINEHGSAAITERRLALKDDEIAVLQTKIQALERAKNEEKVEKEDVSLFHSIELRKGRRTQYKWEPFCPKCHLPVRSSSSMAGTPIATCTDDSCHWESDTLPMELKELIHMTNS